MNIIDKAKLVGKLNTFANQLQRAIDMKNITMIVGSVITLITGVLQVPSIQHATIAYVNSHPTASLLVAGIGSVIALLHNPKEGK